MITDQGTGITRVHAYSDEAISDYVRAELGRRGLTVAALAREVERPENTLRGRLAGRGVWHVTEIFEIARVLAIEPSEILIDAAKVN